MHKALAACLLLACIVNLSCKKSHPGLSGMWNYKAHYVTSGNGYGYWGDPLPGETFLQFNSNGTVATNIISLSDFTHYVMSSDSIRFIYGNHSFKVKYEIAGKTLFIRPNCPETCDYKFEK